MGVKGYLNLFAASSRKRNRVCVMTYMIRHIHYIVYVIVRAPAIKLVHVAKRLKVDCFPWARSTTVPNFMNIKFQAIYRVNMPKSVVAARQN